MRGGGLYREQGQPVGALKCLESFHRRCIDYFRRSVITKWGSPNAERALATVGKVSLLVELLGMAV